MSTWTYSLKCSLRSLVRAGVRNAWGRAFVYPGLAAHERWIGWRFGQRRAWIRGDIVCPDHPRDGRYWCRDWSGNMLMMSSYHLSNETIGRQESIVTQPDGRIIARLDRIFQGHDRHLVEGQMRYRGDGEFVLRVVTADGFADADGRALVDRFLLRVPGVKVRVEQVAAIPPGPNGKFEFIAIER